MTSNLSPFTEETARTKVKAAEDSCNTHPEIVPLTYTEDSHWRNQSYGVFKGRSHQDFLRRKWAVERDYRLMKELWAYTDDRISVRFGTNGTVRLGNGSGLMAMNTGNLIKTG